MDEELIIGHVRFKELKNKKILIYGTGIISQKLLEILSDFNIVGIMDKIQYEGNFCGKPILTWEDIKKDTVDAVIIASSRKNCKVIFNRIQYCCFALGISIYSQYGQNLSREHELKYLDNIDYQYFQKNEVELKKIIDQYEAISFDLFDTLIMRKTLYPVDVFDLVENKIKEKGISIANFKKKRRTAELESKGGNIYRIYDQLRKNIDISKEESMIILQEEIECERQCLIPRLTMIEIMNYAIQSGKIVNIISDMYLPSSVIEPILNKLGIIGYNKLYISCEYGVWKGNGLFQIYREDIGDIKCLHIGDDLFADVISPKKYGIDSYEIKSAFEMLKISSIRKLLICANGINNNLILGLVLSEIFNSPFILYNTYGILTIKTVEHFAKIFIAPTVLIYMQTLAKLLEEKNFKAILFSARDGYLFKILYDTLLQNKCKVPSIYFMASRKLCMSATLKSKQDILEFSHYFSDGKTAESFLKDFLNDTNIISFDPLKHNNIGDYFLDHFQQIKNSSSKLRENYFKYISKSDIHIDSKYLLCDLCSSGTVHDSLNKLFLCELDGFYLFHGYGFKKRNLFVSSVYNTKQWNNIAEKDDLLEVFLTSIDPSVRAIDKNGSPVYSTETRSEQELEMIKKAHQAIIMFFQQYLELRDINDIIGKDLPDVTLGLCEYVMYSDEAKYLLGQENIDDMSQEHISILYE